MKRCFEKAKTAYCGAAEMSLFVYFKMVEKNFILAVLFFISTTAAFSQNINQGEENAAASPLMMFRPGEEKKENRSGSDVDLKNRTTSEGPSSAALRDADLYEANNSAPSPSSSQQRRMPTMEELNREMIDVTKVRVGFDAARELYAEKNEAGERYNDVVSERVLLAKAPQQAAMKANETEQQLEIKRQAHQQGVRSYVWSDRDFSVWELPGELPEIVVPPEDHDIVVLPEMLHEEAEALGRRLLAEANKTANFPEEGVKEAAAAFEEAATLEEKIKNEIIGESLNPSEKNRALIELRLEARAEANKLHKQAATLAKESRRLREAQAVANGKTSAANEKSSVFSSVKSTVFGAFSKANSAIGTGAKEMPMDFETAVQLANEAEQDWGRLALDSERIRSGIKSISAGDRENILTIWKKADQELLALNKKENAAQTLQESWQANVTRWRFCVAEGEAMQQLQCAKEKLIAAQETQAIINDRDLRGKTTSEKKAEASQKLLAARRELDVARAAASEAAIAWRAEALQRESVQDCSQEEEREYALEKLHQSDQGVADVWFKLIDLDEAHLQDELTLEVSRARLKQESERYASKQNMDRARYFGEASEVGLVLADAKKTYRQGNKAAAKSFYDHANELEVAAIQNYRETVKADALEAARNRLPELVAFWVRRMSTAQAEQQARATTAQFKKPSTDSWADETQRALEHATAIAAAEEMGCKIYQEEERRLNDIETLFIAIIAAKKTGLRERPGKAAVAYFAGDATAWESLSADERARYNEETREENKKYERVFEETIKIAKERLELANYEVEKRRYSIRNAVGISNRKQLAIEFVKRVEVQLSQLLAEEEEKIKIRQYAFSTSEERKQYELAAQKWQKSEIDRAQWKAKIEKLSQEIQQALLKKDLTSDRPTSGGIHNTADIIVRQISGHFELFTKDSYYDSRMLAFLDHAIEQNYKLLERLLPAMQFFDNPQIASYWMESIKASCAAVNEYLSAFDRSWGGNRAIDKMVLWATQENIDELEHAIDQQNEYAVLVAAQAEIIAEKYSQAAEATIRGENESVISSLLNQAKIEEQKASVMRKKWPSSTNVRMNSLSTRVGLRFLSFSDDVIEDDEASNESSL